MRHNTTHRILRAYLITQITLLCLTLCASGLLIAGQRTRYIAEGTQAVETILPMLPASLPVPRLPDREAIRAYAPLLPAPVGNLAAIILSVQNILQMPQKE